jgi:hypothetical protein
VFNDLPIRAASSLSALAAETKIGPPIEPVWSQELTVYKTESDTIDALADLRNWAAKTKCFLYIFQISSEFDRDKLRTAYALEAAKKLRRYARLNDSTSSYLYAGGSQDVATRIKQHLGYGNRGTYAMHLSHWASRLRLATTLTIAKYPQMEARVRQALEDALWDKVKPILGRRGTR